MVLTGPDGRLPGFELEVAPVWQVVAPVVRWSRETLDIDLAVLRPLRRDADAASSDPTRRYEAEWLGGGIPIGWHVRSIDDLPESVGSALAIPVGAHQPWYRPGWFAAMSAWVDARLADAGIRRLGPLRQVRSWGRSALLQLETDGGRLWAKDVPAIFAHEVRVAALLTDLDPGLVPSLVAADVNVGRMLMEHVHGAALTAIPDEPLAWTATMARLAEAQRVLAADPAVLEVAGVPQARLHDLAVDVPGLLADDELLRVGQPRGLTEDDAAALRSQVDDLAAAAERLASGPVPSSLDHGDFSADQVIIGEMGPVILDWSDATITHPFLTAASFLGDPADPPSLPIEDLAAAYLGPWGDRADPASLSRMLDDARRIHPLHMAALYARRILPGLDQPWEMDGIVADYLRPAARSAGPAR